jgi:hypothetical protein
MGSVQHVWYFSDELRASFVNGLIYFNILKHSVIYMWIAETLKVLAFRMRCIWLQLNIISFESGNWLIMQMGRALFSEMQTDVLYI